MFRHFAGPWSRYRSQSLGRPPAPAASMTPATIPHRQKSVAPPALSRSRCSHGATLILFAFGLLLTYAFVQHPLPRISPPTDDSSPRRRPVAAGFPVAPNNPVRYKDTEVLGDGGGQVDGNGPAEEKTVREDADAASVDGDDAAPAEQGVRGNVEDTNNDDDSSEKVVHDKFGEKNKYDASSEKAIGPDGDAASVDGDDAVPAAKPLRDNIEETNKEEDSSEKSVRDKIGETIKTDASSDKAVREDDDAAPVDDENASAERTARDETEKAGDEATAPTNGVQKDAATTQANAEVTSWEKSTIEGKAEKNFAAGTTMPAVIKEDDAVTEFRRDKLPNKTSPTGDLSCFLYDRPKRSGSTTMGKALNKCVVERLKFAQPRYFDMQDSSMLVTKMMTATKGPRRGLVSKHLFLSREDLAMIRKRCRNLLYVTSCRPMRERIWSAMKYQFNPGKGNITLTKENHELAMKRLPKNQMEEAALEGHPYLDKDEKRIDISEEERLVPDYVVRNDPEGHYRDDLRALLKVLGCEGDFETANMHVNEHDSEEVFRLIELSLGDTIYRKLKNHGDKVNAGGLKRAAAFIAAAGEEV